MKKFLGLLLAVIILFGAAAIVTNAEPKPAGKAKANLVVKNRLVKSKRHHRHHHRHHRQYKRRMKK